MTSSDVYLHNVPLDAEVDLVSAQLELAHLLDRFIDLAPVNESYEDNSGVARPPRSYNFLGSGLLRTSRQGYLQSWTRFSVTRTEEVMRLMGHDISPAKRTYSAFWSNDVVNSGYHPSQSEWITFHLGEFKDCDADLYNRMTKHADYALIEVTGAAPAVLPLTAESVMKDLEKPKGVRDELWDYGQSIAYDALYFLQRPDSPSTRGARFIVNQTYVPTTPDQVADIAILNTLKAVNIQHAREQGVLAKMRGE